MKKKSNTSICRYKYFKSEFKRFFNKPVILIALSVRQKNKWAIKLNYICNKFDWNKKNRPLNRVSLTASEYFVSSWKQSGLYSNEKFTEFNLIQMNWIELIEMQIIFHILKFSIKVYFRFSEISPLFEGGGVFKYLPSYLFPIAVMRAHT